MADCRKSSCTAALLLCITKSWSQTSREPLCQLLKDTALNYFGCLKESGGNGSWLITCDAKCLRHCHNPLTDLIKKLSDYAIIIRSTPKLTATVCLYNLDSNGDSQSKSSHHSVMPLWMRSGPPMTHEICYSDHRLHPHHQSSRLIWLGRWVIQ